MANCGTKMLLTLSKALNNKDTISVRLNIDDCIFTVESSSEKLTKRMRKQNTY